LKSSLGGSAHSGAKSYTPPIFRILARMFRPLVMRDLAIIEITHPAKKALVYYKTSPFFISRRHFIAHSNNREIVAMVEELNRAGYLVDLVDRGANWNQVQSLLANSYDIFIANAAGNSAPLLSRILGVLKSSVRVFYAAGPEKEISYKWTLARHEEFRRRTGCSCTPRRLVRDFEGSYLDGFDFIFYLGEPRYERYSDKANLPMIVLPSALDHVKSLPAESLGRKSKSRFVYIGGSGHIAKGLDLVLEAFDGLESLRLEIFASTDELDFWECYRPLLDRNPQIKLRGFRSVQSKEFLDATASAMFLVFPSASEANATSVLAGLRRGLIPLVTKGVAPFEIEEIGFIFRNHSVETIRDEIISKAALEDTELMRRGAQCLELGNSYTEHHFRVAFANGLAKCEVAGQIR